MNQPCECNITKLFRGIGRDQFVTKPTKLLGNAITISETENVTVGLRKRIIHAKEEFHSLFCCFVYFDIQVDSIRFSSKKIAFPRPSTYKTCVGQFHPLSESIKLQNIRNPHPAPFDSLMQDKSTQLISPLLLENIKMLIFNDCIRLGHKIIAE